MGGSPCGIATFVVKHEKWATTFLVFSKMSSNGPDIHGAQRLNVIIGDHFTSHLIVSAGQSFQLPSEISQHLLDGLAQKFVQTFVIPM